MSLREPRSFLYDDYMDEDLNDQPSYGRSDVHIRNDRSVGIGSSGHRGVSSRSRGVDFDLDHYASARRPTEGLRRRQDPSGEFGIPGGTGPQARRFADAMGIQSSRSHQRGYDDLEYAPIPRGRLQQIVYREAPPRARQVVRRVVSGGGRGYLDDSREVVEIIERVRRPQHRIQVVRKIPIHQRVVKKVIVKQTVRSGNRRNASFGNNNLGGRVSRVQQGRRNASNTRTASAGVQKKKFPARGGPKKDAKQKISATDLDRELDEYMKGSKHPRVAL